jgi:class 3 adenylate cyclase
MSSSRTQTILFADVSGSTLLFETKGDLEARRLIAAVLDALALICKLHGGRVVKTIGDAIMCSLPNALEGVLAACDMQRKMASDPNFARDRLAVHIGLHHGDALEENGDVYGDAVNTAARMGALAKREQIIASAASIQGLGGKGPAFRTLGRVHVDGKSLPIEIVDIVWQEDTSGLTTVQGIGGGAWPPAMAMEVAGPKLQLCHRGKLIRLDGASGSFTMGRSAINALQIEADWVSRTHALIEFKRGHFVVSDRSTNGTYVKLGEDDELLLRRDELHMRKTGIISLGREAAINADDVIRFEIG